MLPQISPFSFGEEDLNLDETAVATCALLRGDLPVDIWWTHVDDFLGDTRNISSGDGVIITRSNQKMSFLNIDAVKGRHRGNYTCYAKNRAGISQHSAFLSINGELNSDSSSKEISSGYLQFDSFLNTMFLKCQHRSCRIKFKISFSLLLLKIPQRSLQRIFFLSPQFSHK